VGLLYKKRKKCKKKKESKRKENKRNKVLKADGENVFIYFTAKARLELGTWVNHHCLLPNKDVIKADINQDVSSNLKK